MSYPRYALVCDVQSSQLSIFCVDSASGRLTFRSTVPTGHWPVAIAIHPSGAFAYVANSAVPGQPSSDSISAFKVAADGTVAATGPARATRSTPVGLAIAPAGLHLYVACSAATTSQSGIEVFAIDQTTGALSGVAGGGFLGGIPVSALAMRAQGDYLYLLERTTSQITVAVVDARTGALRSVGAALPIGRFPNALAISPAGTLVYVADSGLQAGSGTISTYRVAPATGALTPIGSVVAGTPFRLLAHPSGRFVYALNGFLAILVYQVTALAGALELVSSTSLGPAPGTGVQFSSDIALDPTGSFLIMTFSAAGVANTVTVYAIDAVSGALGPVAGGLSASGGIGPGAIAVVAGSAPVQAVPAYAYVANTVDQSVSAFQIDAVTGALSAIGSPVAVAGEAESIVVDAAGRFAYLIALSLSGGTICTYAINQSTGALTLVGQPVAAQEPIILALAIDPANRFLFAITQLTDTTVQQQRISVFAIDPSTGTLTETGFLSLPAGGFSSPLFGLAVDSAGSHVYTMNSYTAILYTLGIATGSGALSQLASLNVSPLPVVLQLDPFDRFAYLLYSLGADPVGSFILQPGTGLPAASTSAAISAGTSFAFSITLDPKGRFAYVTAITESLSAPILGSIDGYTIDQTSGTFTPMAGNPFPTGGGGGRGATDAAGRFHYVCDEINGTVMGFAIDQSGGQLTMIPGSPFPAGKIPKSIAVLSRLQ